MDASSDLRFLSDHEYISERLNWRLWPDNIISMDKNSQLTRFYHQLALEPGTNIVIWDNLVDASDLVKFANSLPSTKNLCIIITSRNASFSKAFATVAGYIDLPVFSKLDGTKLLKALLHPAKASDDDGLRCLVDDLGSYPLAISQVETYLRITNMSLREYKLALDRVKQDSPPHQLKSYENNLARMCAISFDHP